mmetsp:Transcript_26419/g.56773  ORF Transcript_26419/g.56773 Transcript_26419/m.56773 type:complete len:563 (+) Transcript_26419:264-1952(+)
MWYKLVPLSTTVTENSQFNSISNHNLRRVTSGEVLSNLMKLLVGVIGNDVSLVHNILQHSSMGSLNVRQEGSLEGLHMLDINPVTVSLDTNEETGNNLLGLIGFVLSLLEEFVKTDSTVELLLGGSIKIGTELGEGSNLTVLGQLKLHGTSNGLGGLVLGSGSDTGHGKTNGNGRTLSLVEELRLQENLSISNGNHIGRNVSGHITGLGLNDGKGGQGSTSSVAMHLGSTLQKTGVEVEDISGVSLTARGTTEEKRHLTVGNSLLGEIVVEDHSVLAVVTEVFTHGGTGVRSQELKGGRVGGGSGNNDAVSHGTLLIELSNKLGDGGSLLSNTNVDTGKGIRLRLLVDNGINGNGGLTGLTITNDQLTLSTSNGDKGINGLKAGKHGLGHGFAGNNSGCLHLSTAALAVVKAGASINGLADTIHNTSQKLLADRNVDNGSGTLDSVTLKDVTIVAENHNSNIVLLQVECHAAETAGKDNHLSGLDVGKTVDTGDTISNGDDGSGLGVLDSRVLRSSNGGDFGFEVGGKFEGLGRHGAGGDCGGTGHLRSRRHGCPLCKSCCC